VEHFKGATGYTVHPNKKKLTAATFGPGQHGPIELMLDGSAQTYEQRKPGKYPPVD
jgi:hypothetical protein